MKSGKLPSSIQSELIKLPEDLLSHIERSRLVGKQIATIHDIDLYSVDLAIATHDLAKSLTGAELIVECKKLCLDIQYEYLLLPQLLHGPVAAAWLKNKFNVVDEFVIEAVRYHTTGYPDMNPVAKVVFLADKLDKEKIKRNPELEKVLSISELDLDAAVLEYINIQIKSLIEQNRIIHPYSVACRNNLMKKYLDSN